MMNKIALYPGSFDPLTYGHIDIIQRALQSFEKIIILVSNGEEKKMTFTIHERMRLIEDELKNLVSKNKIEIVTLDGLLTDYMKKNNHKIVIRGLRNVEDFIYEFQLNGMNKSLYDDFETIYFISNNKHLHISSRLVKSIALNDGNVEKFTPSNIAKALKEKLKGV